jgi:8-hydroxy-5-deazaflavin:NADPH oxidoreductase
VIRTLGLVGAGRIGTALARLATQAGLSVVVSNSRGPQSLADLVSELGEQARAADAATAAREGDLVIVTVPLGACQALPAAQLAGKAVIDTMNYYPERDNPIAVVNEQKLTSSGYVQHTLAGARVVKAFNNIDWIRLEHSGRPSGAPDRSALPIAGDDETAKQEVTQLLDRLGYDTVDIGSLAESWRSEPGTPVYVNPYLPPRPDGPDGGITTADWFASTANTPVSAARVAELVRSAVRQRPENARERLN